MIIFEMLLNTRIIEWVIISMKTRNITKETRNQYLNNDVINKKVR